MEELGLSIFDIYFCEMNILQTFALASDCQKEHFSLLLLVLLANGDQILRGFLFQCECEIIDIILGSTIRLLN